MNEREFRKKLITEAVRKILIDKGRENISMREIAGEVGLSPASLYSYFESQDEIFLEVFLNDLEKIHVLLNDDQDINRLGAERSAVEKLGRTFNYLIGNKTTLQMIGFFMSEKSIPVHAQNKIERLKKDINNHVINLLKVFGIQNPDNSLAQAFFASILGSVILFGNSFSHGNDDHGVSPNEILSVIMHAFKAGGSSPENNRMPDYLMHDDAENSWA
jgi:AcrR family transcriptional regulator